VRVLVRSPQELNGVPWADQVDIARGDFERTERTAAENVAVAAEAGVSRIVCAWAVRIWMDKIIGGVVLPRGRCNPDLLHTRDVLDF
jgi:hypothetical protein